MDVPALYQQIHTKLQKNHRGLIELSKEDKTWLNSSLKDHIDLADYSSLEMELTILNYLNRADQIFESILIEILKSNCIPFNLLILTLNASRKHIIEARLLKGQRMDWDFLECLKKHLTHPNVHVVEWTLRVIEECGNQGVIFLEKMNSIKPPFWKLFHKTQRNIREIIHLLELRWKKYEK